MTERQPPDQDTAVSEMIRLLDLSARQAAEIERLRAAYEYAEAHAARLMHERDAAVASERERWTALAASVVLQRDRYGWSPEADKAIDALRAALRL